MKKEMCRFLSVLLVLSGMTLSGCEKDKDAPQMPPESAFVMDLNDFSAGGKSTLTNANWAAAVITTGVWNLAITVTLAVPVATYVEALKHEPVRIDNDSWKWSFNVTANAIQYTAELFADVAGSDVTWKMYVSQEGGFSNFLWFKGTCDILRTHGDWILYTGPLLNTEFLRIDWTHDWETNTGDIKYTNINPNADGYESYISYGLTTDAAYNAFYTIYDNAQDKLVDIKYNTVTHAGSILYDDQWHCWNTLLEDVECPVR